LNNTLLNDEWVTEEIRKEIKKFLDANENEDTTYQNLWDIAKPVIRGKFLAMSALFRKLEQLQINNLMTYLKLLEKEEQANPKSNIQKEITKPEQKQYNRINKTKSWFFEKIN
jgi:hypothetical protein